jgi:hypothetical protein
MSSYGSHSINCVLCRKNSSQLPFGPIGICQKLPLTQIFLQSNIHIHIYKIFCLIFTYILNVYLCHMINAELSAGSIRYRLNFIQEIDRFLNSSHSN